MTARAAIKQSDLKRMAAIAKQEGVVVEIENNGIKIRIITEKRSEPIAPVGGIDL